MAEPRMKPPVMGQGRAPNFGMAWLALCLALAAHVTDEALTGFLDVYNPAVESIRQRVPFLPLPTFTFGVWLAGLILAILLLLVLSPFAFRRARWMVPVAYTFGVLMVANGVQHIVGSIYMKEAVPGVYSSPVLLVCSVYLLMRVRDREGAESHV
jgi:Protein of unknown function with HXXEE motif